ncbi:MAG TPA: S8 family serine peptidase [candidate division Zixibacteria bacterium]
MICERLQETSSYRTARAFGVVAVLLVSAVGSASWAADLYRPDVLVVQLRPASAKIVGLTKNVAATGIASLDELNVSNAAISLHRTVPPAVPASEGGHDHHGLHRFYTIEFMPGSDMEAIREQYAVDPNIEVAEFDYIMPLTAVPNDPGYDDQWTHNQINDHDIDTEEAWDLEVGDSTILVGIIDSGVEYLHADLNWSIWVNPGEDLDGDGKVWDTDDIDGIDNDGNGYIDDLIGYDFLPVTGACWAGEDCNGPDNNPEDFAGHGTHVGGIVGATTDNGIGVAGVAGGFRGQRRPGVKLMALRAGYLANSGNGFVNMTACAAAANYAVAKGVSVINCSWGSSGALIRTAMLNAVTSGVVVCKSAGNDGGTPDEEIPDILDTTFGVMAIASVDWFDKKSGFSSFGTWVDISAPGSDIYNTYSSLGSPTYASLSGTSMSSPTVAGVAALIKSHHPSYDRTDIEPILFSTAENIDAENPTLIGKLGAGRINALFALQTLSTADFEADIAFGSAPLTVNFTDISPNAPDPPYSYDFGDGNNAATQDAENTYDDPGIYNVTYTASGPSGPHTRIRPEMIVVVQDTIEYGDIEVEIGQKGGIPVRLRNTHPMSEVLMPLDLIGSPTTRIDSIQLNSLTVGWNKTNVYNNFLFGQGAFLIRALGSGTPIPAGDHIVAYMWMRVTAGTPGQVETADSATFSGNGLTLASYWATFKPEFIPGSVTIPLPPCDCPCLGDPICDSVVNVFDVVSAVDVAFRAGAPIFDLACPRERTDVDCNGVTNVFDVIKIVDVSFRAVDPAVAYCDPCL